ncbi:helix-turn-helix domain-containing protein [Pseudoroseomonas wenyumeiae]
MSTHKGKNASPAAEGPLFLQSTARTLRVLEVFAQQPRPLSIAELAAAAGLNKSAGQRIVHTLQAMGYLDRSSEDWSPARRPSTAPSTSCA